MASLVRVSLLLAVAACLVPTHAARADEVRDAVEAGSCAFIAAFLRGDSTAVSQLLVAKDTTSQGRYVVVWKRVDGRWLLHRDTWNSSE
jgi:ketosteroid isomerase-like protein